MVIEEIIIIVAGNKFQFTRRMLIIMLTISDYTIQFHRYLLWNKNIQNNPDLRPFFNRGFQQTFEFVLFSS